MSDFFLGDLPTGSVVASPARRGNVVGSIGTHDLATAERVALARRYFLEVDESDFDRRGRVWIHRATRKEYRRLGSDPLADGRSDQELLFYIAGGRLTYLRERGRERVSSVELGSVTGPRSASAPPRPAATHHGSTDGREAGGAPWLSYHEELGSDSDRRRWEAAGRPRIPQHLRRPDPPAKPLDVQPVPATKLIPSGFGLH